MCLIYKILINKLIKKFGVVYVYNYVKKMNNLTSKERSEFLDYIKKIGKENELNEFNLD